MEAPTVVLSFAAEDEPWAQRVRVALTCLGHQERLCCWDPRDAPATADLGTALTEAIERASLAILLISQSYLTSGRVKTVDVPALLERRRTGDLQLLFLLVRPCPWRTVRWIEDTQLFPPGDRALSSGSEHEIDQTLTDLAYQVNGLLP